MRATRAEEKVHRLAYMGRSHMLLLFTRSLGVATLADFQEMNPVAFDQGYVLRRNLESLMRAELLACTDGHHYQLTTRGAQSLYRAARPFQEDTE